MKARDIFGLVVRSIGLCLLLISIWYLLYAAAYIFNAFPNLNSEPDIAVYILTGGAGIFSAFILLRFARPIVRFCYPEGKEDSDE
jgi:hypothetical protein